MSVPPRCVSLSPKHVDGIGSAIVLEGACKFCAAIVHECARFAYTLHVLLECIKGVNFGADGGDVYVAGA